MFILMPLSFSSCGCCDNTSELNGDWVKKIDAPEIVHVIQNFLAYLRHEKHLRLEDSGVYYNEFINSIRMEFICMDLLEVREARMLLVDLVEGLLVELNKNPVLAPEFITYPLTPRHLEIYIDFESFYGLFNDVYYVGWIKLEKDIAYYYAMDLKYPSGMLNLPNINFWDFRIEPYYKSRELVIYERESEQLFKQSVEIEENTPDWLKKEWYRPKEKCRPRYFPPYDCQPLFQ